MAINVSQAFHRTSANPIDETMTLTKAQMSLINDNLMPQYYLTICQDDGAIYLYDKSATPSVETGKFHKLEAGEKYVTNDDLGELIVSVYNPEKSDYAVNDYVIYLKRLYRCKTANTTNLPTNTTDWEKVNIIETINKKVEEHVPDLSNCVDNSDLGNLIVALYTSTSYNVGDYCIHNKKFYKCISNISSAEEWNPSHWIEVTILEVMDSKIDAIDLSMFLTETDANHMIAANWVRTDTYEIGEYVLYNREIYRCKAAVTANLNWNAHKWDKVKLTNVFNGSVPGLVPAATVDDSHSVLKGDGTWMPYKKVKVSYDAEIEELHINFSGLERTDWTLSDNTIVTDSSGNNVEVETVF